MTLGRQQQSSHHTHPQVTMKVIITGASGVLGSAIYSEFQRDSFFEIKGLSHSSPRDDLTKINLLDAHATENVIASFKPDWVIHCAAERRPDVASQNPELAQKLNAEVPKTLADLSYKYNFILVYISTDYVFDGTSPPYEVDATPNPVNFYGKTKREGEIAILKTQNGVSKGQRVVLRVPVLYGPSPRNSDTAINILVDIVQDQSGKTYKMDHFATRFPTNTIDIASFLHRLILDKPQDPLSNAPTGSTRNLPSIIHYSAAEPFTKYEICLIFSKILGLPNGHIVPDAEEPTGEAAVSRPKNCMLSTRVIEDVLQMDVGAGLFEEWWSTYLNAAKSG
ncbi:hypothetical protein FRB95_006977 [Tulasnella sp. JGI-2019a]|nr:hypothetical protein FRB95_006977 [Tulasnella sp. JGI-2019a]